MGNKVILEANQKIKEFCLKLINSKKMRPTNLSFPENIN